MIEATLRVVGERGIGAATIDEIAARAGVAKTTIYRHWRSKPELVVDALRTIVDPAVDPETGCLRDDLRVLAGNLVRTLTRSRFATLLPALLQGAVHDPEVAEVRERFTSERRAVTRAVIRRGIRNGELPQGTDPDEVAALVAGPLFFRRLVSAEPVTDAFARRVVDRVVAAYQQDPRGERKP